MKVPQGVLQLQCIYCLKEKTFSTSSRVANEFSAEHVINRAFVEGFGGKGKTLIGRVCSDCNQSFKDTVDAEITLKGPEALMRFASGKKSVAEIGKFNSNNNVTIMSASLPGDIKHGSPIQAVNKAEKFAMGQAASIFYRLPDDESASSMSIKDFVWGGWKNFQIPNLEVRLEGANDAELQFVNAWMKHKRINFIAQAPYTDSPQVIPIDTTINLTHEYRRGLAKIAFNYLAYCTADRLPQFIFDKMFDPIRAYIYQGVQPKLEPIEMLVQPEAGIVEKTSGLKHHLRIGVTHYQNRPMLACNVQLMGFATWRVFLADDYTNLDLFVATAHTWDCDTYQITENLNEAKHYEAQTEAMKYVEPSMIIRPTNNDIAKVQDSKLF